MDRQGSDILDVVGAYGAPDFVDQFVEHLQALTMLGPYPLPLVIGGCGGRAWSYSSRITQVVDQLVLVRRSSIAPCS